MKLKQIFQFNNQKMRFNRFKIIHLKILKKFLNKNLTIKKKTFHRTIMNYVRNNKFLINLKISKMKMRMLIQSLFGRNQRMKPKFKISNCQNTFLMKVIIKIINLAQNNLEYPELALPYLDQAISLFQYNEEAILLKGKN